MYCHPFASVETNGPIGTKFGRNGHWMILWKCYGFCCWLEVHKKDTHRCQKLCCLFLIFFSGTTEPIGTKLGRNVHLLLRSIHKKQDAQKMLSVFVCGVHIFQPISIFLVKWSSYSIPTGYYQACCFQDVRGSKWGQHPKFFIFILSPIVLLRLLMKFPVCIFSTRFDLALVVSED